MRIIFCDDEESVLQELSALVLEYFAENGLAEPELSLYAGGEELLEQEDRAEAPRAELAFLDVEMWRAIPILYCGQFNSGSLYLAVYHSDL